MSMEPTSEQQAAIDCEGNVVVTARPGSGKTFTLARMIARESSRLLSYQGVIAISYTNKASDELRDRCKRLGVERRLSFFGTIDSFCMGQVVAPFASHITHKAVNLSLIEDKLCSEWDDLKDRTMDDEDLRSFILKSLRDGSLPIGALGPTALLILEMVSQAVEFVKARYTAVFIDEYQDCGIYQHLLMKKLISLGLRGIAVGDIDQAIFRFAGKSPDHLHEFMTSAEFQHFQITKNHRCDKAIQAYSLALLGAHPEPIPCADRRVFVVRMSGNEEALSTGIRGHLPMIMDKYGVNERREVALIGYGNKTLDRFASHIDLPHKRFSETPLDKGFSKWNRVLSSLLSEYYNPLRFSGRFLDDHLGTLAKPTRRKRGVALLEEYFSLSENELADRIDLATSIAQLCEPDYDNRDAVEAYRSVVKNVELLRSGFKPASPDEVNILTYHKAKGLEFDIVFCLETYQYIMPPYRYEEKSFDAYGQALCMHYVGITRAKKICYILLGSTRHKANGEPKPALPSEFLNYPRLADLRIDATW